MMTSAMIIDLDILEMNAEQLELEYRRQVDVCASLDLEDKQALVQVLRLWSNRTLHKSEGEE